MKLKELKRTVNASWSPCEQYPVMLAAGSAAQQVDASFSSTSQLELYSLNLEDPGLDLELKCTFQTKHKFQKIVWSGAGVIVGGCDGGLLEFYSTDKLLKNASDPLLASSVKHNGQVSALDINPYQRNLVASGAAESEIFIWDLNNTAQPMAPGGKSQPLEHVQAVAWNQQVQHILGSTFATRCVVWDLRKNEPIMKLSDCQSRSRWRALAWHPSVATQLCVASEDDSAPFLQLWDLRLAASPLLTLEGHQKGAMSVSWSKHDPTLLLSAGKDGRVLCWDPDTTQPGQPPLEISRQQQWVFDVSWSPRIPGLLATTSFDQQLSVHSLLATDKPESSSQTQNNIMDSFGGLESFNQLPAVQRESISLPAPVQPTRAPSWLRRPVAAKFGFGGKLVTFEKCPQESGSQRVAYISQVVSEQDFVEQATQLDAVLSSNDTDDATSNEQLAEYCRLRGDAAQDQSERYSWFFLRANFLPDYKSEVLNLLGFKQDEIPSKFKNPAVLGDNEQNDLAVLSRGESTDTEPELSAETSTVPYSDENLLERRLANIQLEPLEESVVIPNGDDPTSLICRALVCGNIEEAVELCVSSGRIADALIIASLGGEELVQKVQVFHLQQSSRDPVALLTAAARGHWVRALRAAHPPAWPHLLAAALALPPARGHCEMLAERLLEESKSDPSLRQAAAICFTCALRPRGGPRLLLARRAARLNGESLQNNDKIDAELSKYAWRLASQGCLQSALNALEGIEVSELKERLLVVLGHRQELRQQQQHGGRAAHAQTRARGSIPTAYNTGPYEPQPWPTPVSAAPAFPTPPARPGSVGPQPAGVTSRSKYKVDPSVQAAPLYNQYSFNSTAQAGYGQPLMDQYSSASVPNAGFTPVNNTVLQNHQGNSLNPLHPAVPLNPMNPSVPLNPLNPQAPLNPLNPVVPLNPLNPAAAVNGTYYNNPPVDPPAPVKPAAPGWNDPPILTSKPKPIYAADMSALHAGTRQWGHIIEHRRQTDEPKQEVQAQAPITHPLFGVEPQHVPLTGPVQYQNQPPQQYPGQGYQNQLPQGYQNQAQYPAQQQYVGQQNQYPGQYQPVSQMYPEQINQSYQHGRESPAVAAPPAPVVKKPIPDQYSAMVNVFESLKTECINKANNVQMKRKLDDVQKRLELLYDLLRENALSESAVSSLDQCASLAASGSATAASDAAASLAAGADFAAVAGFLPALRTLLQIARQLQLAN